MQEELLPLARQRRHRCSCGLILCSGGAFLLLVTASVIAAAVVSFVKSIQTTSRRNGLAVCECNVTESQLLIQQGGCHGNSLPWPWPVPRMAQRKAERDHTCYAPHWSVLYEDLSPTGAAMKAGVDGGTIVGTFSPHREAAAQQLHHYDPHGKLEPCQYDPDQPAVAFWSPRSLIQQAEDLQLVALILGGAGLGGALLSGACITSGLRRIRRRTPVLEINAPS